MNEHGWPDFHDDGLHHDGAPHEDVAQHEDAHDPVLPDDDHSFYDVRHEESLPGHEGLESHEPVHTSFAADDELPHVHELPEPDEVHNTVGADPDALPEPDAAVALTAFPPVVDVGPLPEPVDGFPWIDTGSLGLVDPATVHAAGGTEVSPAELASYAGTELPPGQDPWAALADSEDPATSALARWWSEQQ